MKEFQKKSFVKNGLELYIHRLSYTSSIEVSLSENLCISTYNICNKWKMPRLSNVEDLKQNKSFFKLRKTILFNEGGTSHTN